MNDAAPARDPEGNTRIVHILYILHGLAPFPMCLRAVVAIWRHGFRSPPSTPSSA